MGLARGLPGGIAREPGQGAGAGSRGRQPFPNVYVHRVCRQGFWHMLRTASALKTDLRVLAMMQTFRNTGVGVLNL